MSASKLAPSKDSLANHPIIKNLKKSSLESKEEKRNDEPLKPKKKKPNVNLNKHI